jgi:hypothetical protein
MMAYKLTGILLFAGSLIHVLAQETPAGGGTPPQPDPAEVRRFSLGATASFLPLPLMGDRDVNQSFPEGPLEVTATASSLANWASGGAAVQVALSERWALGLQFLLRGSGYELTTVNLVGTDDPDTVADERTTTTITEQTRARYLDVPVLLRRYNKSRYSPGIRWFFQAGAAARSVHNIRTSVETVKGTERTSDDTPARPAHRNVLGVVAGGGLHLVDDFGFRVIPEVRYTRWFGTTFDSLSAYSRRDQVEVVFTLGF